MTATVSTFDNTTKRALNPAQTTSRGTSRRADAESYEYDPNESAADSCARSQREDFSALERVLAAR